MTRTRSRSTSVREDEALRLPRTPGVLRRFWARHPVFADVLIALVCLLLSLVPAGVIANDLPTPLAIGVAILVPASVVAACATLLWRRRRPLLPFVASFALEAGFLFALQPIGSPLLLVTCYSLAVYRSSRVAWIGFGIGLASLAAFGGLLTLTGVITFQIAANAVIMSLVLGLIGTLIGVNVGGRKRYLDAVIDRSRQLLVERDQQAQLAAAGERARIAREMHDIVSHSLTVIVALSEGAAATSDPDQARAAATASAETARSALTEMRAMLGVLRADDSPLPLAPLAPTPPQETVAHAQRAGYPVTLSVSGGADLSPAVAHAVGRIVQEGVTNAMRHAPGATSIAVRLIYSADTVTAEIVNDGATGPRGTSGFGLRGLAERAAHAGGSVVSEPLEGGRWMLRAELPTAPPDPTPTALAAPDPKDRP
ncbi:sensor histidine kinase [Microbacterium phyllosphaerae]|uniref:sensor histidine kinase n=1 Tax=Microbacterium phyllosphaerae TaxID=124798 RepID=UPI0021676A8E|nr:histidine kinase [Microbacterium phyllosphaerae]MCS3443770.1 signal transduction histidine kinase [Microbacterium phyllosphaerae]